MFHIVLRPNAGRPYTQRALSLGRSVIAAILSQLAARYYSVGFAPVRACCVGASENAVVQLVLCIAEAGSMTYVPDDFNKAATAVSFFFFFSLALPLSLVVRESIFTCRVLFAYTCVNVCNIVGLEMNFLFKTSVYYCLFLCRLSEGVALYKRFVFGQHRASTDAACLPSVLSVVRRHGVRRRRCGKTTRLTIVTKKSAL